MNLSVHFLPGLVATHTRRLCQFLIVGFLLREASRQSIVNAWARRLGNRAQLGVRGPLSVPEKGPTEASFGVDIMG